MKRCRTEGCERCDYRLPCAAYIGPGTTVACSATLVIPIVPNHSLEPSACDLRLSSIIGKPPSPQMSLPVKAPASAGLCCSAKCLRERPRQWPGDSPGLPAVFRPRGFPYRAQGPIDLRGPFSCIEAAPKARGLLSRGPLARARGRSGALSARHGRPCGAPSREPAWFRGKAGRQPAAAQRGTHLQA